GGGPRGYSGLGPGPDPAEPLERGGGAVPGGGQHVGGDVRLLDEDRQDPAGDLLLTEDHQVVAAAGEGAEEQVRCAGGGAGDQVLGEVGGPGLVAGGQHDQVRGEAQVPGVGPGAQVRDGAVGVHGGDVAGRRDPPLGHPSQHGI